MNKSYVTELGKSIFLPGRFQVFVKYGSFFIFDGWWKIQRHLLIYLLQSSGFKLILWLDGQLSCWSNVYGGSKDLRLKYLFENIYQFKISIFVLIKIIRSRQKPTSDPCISPITSGSSGRPLAKSKRFAKEASRESQANIAFILLIKTILL